MIAFAQRLVLILALVTTQTVADVVDEETAHHEYILQNLEFILLHELAHVILDDNDVPLLGPLEDAADYMAIIMAIRGNETADKDSFMAKVLRNTAKSFATTWALAQQRNVEIQYWDVHALSIQRYYAALCLVYGSNPAQHSELLDELPAGRAPNCEGEYELADKGYQWLVDTYSVLGSGIGSGIDADVKAVHPQETSISVNYDFPHSTIQTRVSAAAKQARLIGNTVEAVFELFPPKHPINVTMRSCRVANAFWMPERREVVVCYELIDVFSQIYRLQRQRDSSE